MRDTPQAIMLFAAGLGTRMKPLTDQLPKPLVQVSGMPLIDHTLALVNAAGDLTKVINLHHLPDQLEAHLAGQGIQFSREEPVLLETGGGLRAALPLLGAGPVFTMNTDAVWRGPNPLNVLKDSWNPSQMEALLLCVPKDNAKGHKGAGDFVLSPNGRASRGAGSIYTGLQIIKTDRLEKIDQSVFSLNLIWDQMLQDKTLFAIDYPGQWCDVGHPESIAIAENMLAGEHV